MKGMTLENKSVTIMAFEAEVANQAGTLSRHWHLVSPLVSCPWMSDAVL